MERFVRDQNLHRFIARLQVEPDSGRRQTLQRMLIDEEDRYGSRAERLDTVDRLIAEARARIQHHERLIASGFASAEADAITGRVLVHERDILAIALKYRRVVQDGLDRIDL